MNTLAPKHLRYLPLLSGATFSAMSRADDCRKHAKEARETAALLSISSDRALWLKIAEEWERMAEEADGRQQGGQLAEQPRAVPPEPEGKG